MSFQAYLDNVQAKTGKSAEEFKRLAKKKGLVQHEDLIAWLTAEWGLGLGHARAIAHYIRHGGASETLPLAGQRKTTRQTGER